MDLNQIENKIITVQGQHVILDRDVAELYGVETKRVNEAIKNNPGKFPDGYVIELSDDEKSEVVKNFDHLAKLKFSPIPVKGISEKGLYMLATILKSPSATETTLAIIETFAKVRELVRTVNHVAQHPSEDNQQSFLQHAGKIVTDIVNPALEVTDIETTVELNIAIFSAKQTVKRSITNK
jgi:hypothetical protein